jgi:hypothetical protein
MGTSGMIKCFLAMNFEKEERKSRQHTAFAVSFYPVSCDPWPDWPDWALTFNISFDAAEKYFCRRNTSLLVIIVEFETLL